MLLRQTLEHAVNGYWDGGTKQVFDWTIDYSHIGLDSKGQYVRISCWTVNHWFSVTFGKTERLILSYAKRHLQAVTRIPCKFEYIN